jgi:hypothetical protein
MFENKTKTQNEVQQEADKIGEFLSDIDKPKIQDNTDIIYGSLNAPRTDSNGDAIDKIVQDGKIKDGSEYGVHIKCIESMSQKGNQVFYLYQKIGAIFPADKADKPDLVLQGDATINGQEKFVQGYNQSKDGDSWVSLSIYPKRDEQ